MRLKPDRANIKTEPANSQILTAYSLNNKFKNYEDSSARFPQIGRCNRN